jgi:hypothetical protein
MDVSGVATRRVNGLRPSYYAHGYPKPYVSAGSRRTTVESLLFSEKIKYQKYEVIIKFAPDLLLASGHPLLGLQFG